MPYRFMEEIATADVAFQAWGKSQEEMFISAAGALLRTMVDDPELVERRSGLTIRLENEELDLLLFSFLQELIFYKDARRLLLHADAVRFETCDGIFRLEAAVSGEDISTERHRLLVDVKAVTLHRLQVVCEADSCTATVVLDI